ncbi:CLUMA_CG000040, isoform A [Clunio marinus]|uniref:CLUMA_CG000040, isoform A n=1 Tax=Clunio marinus TaxID=568069 RepID=A0A1J1HEB1_9DIPT|nr:CLUMA_CG000040, isoform A [Clunio marinus]
MFNIILICLAGVAFAGAQTNDPTFDGIFTTPTPTSALTDEYVQPQNKQDQFDWRLSRAVFQSSKGGNVILSPLSVKLLLTLLAEAAGQTVESLTRKELEQVLPYNKNLNDAKEYFQKILLSLESKSEEYAVNFGTKIYVDKNVAVNQRFGSIANHNYLVDIENLNFDDSRGSAQKINSWISESTKGRLKSLVTEDSVANSVILLINALYFEGTWRYGFNNTFTGGFYSQPGQRVDKSFVEVTRNFYYYYSKQLASHIIRLPYNGRRYSMFIILPKEPNGLEGVVNRVDSEILRNEVENVDETEVHVVLPKFKFDSSINLNDVIKSLGIREIFETNATFPLLARGGTTEGKLKVSNIIQKSGIVVDEKGTTAWSATEIELVNKFGGEPREFIADHPFLFYIEDDTTGAKLFTGIVNNPEF